LYVATSENTFALSLIALAPGFTIKGLRKKSAYLLTCQGFVLLCAMSAEARSRDVVNRVPVALRSASPSDGNHSQVPSGSAF
jgi:hypothetical protein